MLKLIRALYQLETRLERNALTNPGAIAAARAARAAPLLDRLRIFVDQLATQLNPKTELGAAIQYALNQWPALVRYTEDGRLEPDSNRCQRLRCEVCVGSKNWMLNGATAGGEASATLLTVFETYPLNSVNPRDHLIDVVRRIQDHLVNRLDELLPHNWTPQTLTG